MADATADLRKSIGQEHYPECRWQLLDRIKAVADRSCAREERCSRESQRSESCARWVGLRQGVGRGYTAAIINVESRNPPELRHQRHTFCCKLRSSASFENDLEGTGEENPTIS